MAGLNTGSGAGSGIRAGRSFVEMSLRDMPLQVSLKRLEKRFKAFGSTIAKVGGGIGGIGLALSAPLAGLFSAGVDRAAEFKDLSEIFGITTEAASKMAYAFDVAGSGMDDLGPALSKLAASNKSGKPLDEYMLDVADGLNQIEDASERFRAAKEIFGGKFAAKFMDVGGDLRKLMGEYNGIDKETAANAERVQMEFRKIGIAAKEGLLPLLKLLTPVIQQFGQFVRDNARFLPIVAAVGAALMAAGTAITLFGVGLSAVGTIIGFVTSPLTLTVLAVTALAAGMAYLFSLTSTGQGFFSMLADGFGSLGSAWQGIQDAMSAGDMGLAGEIAMTGLMLAFAKAIVFMEKKWAGFKSLFVDGWYDAIMLVKIGWSGLGEWFNDLLLGMVKGLNDMFGVSIKKIIENLADVLDAADPLGLFKDTIEGLRNLGGAFGSSGFSTELQKQREMNKKEAEAERKRIHDQAQQDQMDRNKAREGDIAGAGKDVRTLEEWLEILKARAAHAAAPWLEIDAGGKMSRAAQVGESVKGGFGGANAREMFGLGDKGVAKEQLGVQKQIRDGVKGVEEAVINLEGLGFS